MFKNLTISSIAGISLLALAGAAGATTITSTGDAALTGASIESFNSAAIGDHSSQTVNDISISISAGTFSFSTGSNGQFVPPNPAGDVFILATSQLLRFDFNSNVSAFGINVGATNQEQTLSAYDFADNLIEALVIPDQVATLPTPFAGFYGIASGSPDIAYFTVTNTGDAVIYDDLHYVSRTQVPEPATLAIMGLGLAGLAFARRRTVAA